MSEERRAHRPGLYADLTDFIDAAGGENAPSRVELAAATAAVVVQAGRDGAEGPFVDLADRVGLETLAALWRDADPVSLAGSLWALYLLRQWCRTNGDEVRRLWTAGEAFATPDAVVAGLAEPGDVDAVQRMADDVLGGAYRGDFDVALERAAAMFRVVAAGRRQLFEDSSAQRELAERNDRVAADLATAAERWRAGRLR